MTSCIKDYIEQTILALKKFMIHYGTKVHVTADNLEKKKTEERIRRNGQAQGAMLHRIKSTKPTKKKRIFVQNTI